MSHLTRIELELQDLQVLKSACKRLNLEFRQDQKEFVWFARRRTSCEAVIKVPGANYEIGIIRNQDRKGYNLQTDFYDKNIGRAIGPNGGLLKQAYAIEKGKLEARKKGYQVFEQQTQNGIQLRIRIGR
jgi:hypothetical protein